ncbi:MAG: hypothetical protein WDN01_12570 [Rhizomicrobium sp.]
MSACAMLKFNGVTQQAWECGTEEVKRQYGIVIDSNSGTASKDGFAIKWNYVPAAQTLSIQCTKSPWYVPCSAINNRINDLVEGCLKQYQITMTDMVTA